MEVATIRLPAGATLTRRVKSRRKSALFHILKALESKWRVAKSSENIRLFYTTSMRILGIDPGTGILGFGIIEAKKGQVQLVDAGVIRTPVKEDDAVRLLTIYDELTDIIATTKPAMMSVEKLFFARNVTTAMTVAQARGVVLLCGQQAGLQLFEYTPMQIKQAITGYGRADKKQMQEMVRVILKLQEIPRPDDAADALAAAITHSMTLPAN